jgi:hypothetical protein
MKKITIIIGAIVILTLIGISLITWSNQSQKCMEHGTEPEITSDECIKLGGEIINTLNYGSCCSEVDFLGTVTGMECPCVCCKK